jgi:hypothetical protein
MHFAISMIVKGVWRSAKSFQISVQKLPELPLLDLEFHLPEFDFMDMKCLNESTGLNPSHGQFCEFGHNVLAYLCVPCTTICKKQYDLEICDGMGVCQCQVLGDCKLFTGPLLDLPPFLCNLCKEPILFHLFISCEELMPMYYCQTCAERMINIQPCIYTVPSLSSLTWQKTKTLWEKSWQRYMKYTKHVTRGTHRYKNIHWGFKCGLCLGLIDGRRFECLVCDPYSSFCSECWADHDSTHKFLIIPMPLSNPIECFCY